ncbi:LacI family transcriptional regulator [Streptomyces lunaelactis]|uniref:LacI family transcriptional regulator n=1 Tax=Streptomyces lunaelactis TaxID=1535768 RepID=A0A2R4SXG1_9ACTN|nr:LacI family DNA-binding transcriptional regulator [Streptomyces lunaelactis]AVZ71566.1 LacI family transcriptional regulator [Streptomyces lunaelactis]NUK00349.1 LacI family DNA-binding transcriptional regulator [Streptomyces lunaelactis]NUK10656.1 LacI family DNA-binding transcriptional regulator [Streptomyces lunaelactis]NUK14157.1 LacI family DNA-binding transcriptional regulator [Streptomyces lunaelactis]NUK21765.1 LacI family DNA-binding transcriptional regulator [Streptomyces lunaelac
MRVSLKDVAERAGVSIKTVSNVVNNYQHVTPAMRTRVQRAIDELGYRPNLTARHLRKGRTGIIALAVPELGNPYFAELAGAVVDAAAEHDYTVLLDHTRGSREQEILVSQGFRARVIDGLILSPLELEAEDLQSRTDDAPLVLLGEREYDLPYDHIAIDNVAASQAAVRHLLGLGRTRIAFLGARTDTANRPAQLRLRGWREELTAAGLPAPDGMVGAVGGWDRGDGALAMAEMLDAGIRPDAVFAFNDLIAIGAMRVLHERGLRVPWDVAVVGFDDIAEGRFGAVTLTTVSPDKRSIARLAVESVIGSLEGAKRGAEARGGRELTADFRLVERESTLGRR